jgi:hypothetical protein
MFGVEGEHKVGGGCGNSHFVFAASLPLYPTVWPHPGVGLASFGGSCFNYSETRKYGVAFFFPEVGRQSSTWHE